MLKRWGGERTIFSAFDHQHVAAVVPRLKTRIQKAGVISLFQIANDFGTILQKKYPVCALLSSDRAYLIKVRNAERERLAAPAPTEQPPKETLRYK